MQHLQKTGGEGATWEFPWECGGLPPLFSHPPRINQTQLNHSYAHYDQALTKCQFCKPFFMMIFHLMGV